MTTFSPSSARRSGRGLIGGCPPNRQPSRGSPQAGPPIVHAPPAIVDRVAAAHGHACKTRTMNCTMTVSGMKVGYARVSTSEQDLTVQRNALLGFGVDEEHIFVDHGLTGTNRARPGLREAMAAVRAGDTLVVSKLDRLSRSLPDARDIADEFAAKGVWLSLGGSTHDPPDGVGRVPFNILGMVAEFEADLIRMRTREGMAARARGLPAGRSAG